MSIESWRARWRHPGLLACVVLFFATAIFFHDLFRGESFSTVQMYQSAIYPWAAHPTGLTFFPQSDQAALSYPFQCLYQRALRFGEPPLWDPYSFLFGYPFASNGSSAVFSPVRLLSTLLTSDAQRAHDAFAFLCVFFSGIAARACARAFGVGHWGSLLSGVTWMFCGWNLSWLHLEVVAPLGFNLPLVVLCIRKGVQQRRFGWVLAGSAIVALTLISGHALLMGIVCVVGAVQFGITLVVTIFRRQARTALLQTCDGVLLFGLGVLLAAFVLVPTAINLFASQRQPFSWSELNSVWLGTWKSFTVRTVIPPRLPISDAEMHEMGFIGALAGVLAIWGALRRSEARFAGILLWALPAAVATGTPLTWVAYHFLPAFDVFRPYSRLVFVSAFGLCLLAGAGLDGVVALPLLRRKQILAVAVAAVVIVVNTAQLVKYGHAVNPPPVPPAMAPYPELPSIDALRARQAVGPTGWPARILPVRVNDAEGSWTPVLFGDFGPVLGLVVGTGYDSAVPRRTVDALRVLSGEPARAVLASGLPGAYTPNFPSGSLRADLLPRFGVNLVLAGPQHSRRELWSESWTGLAKQAGYRGPEGRVYRLQGVDTGPYFAARIIQVREGDEALLQLVDGPFQRGTDVILESADLRGAAPVSAAQAKVTLLARTVNTVRLAIDTAQAGWLVVPIAYSMGWKAAVAGQEARTVHANYSEMAVLIPAGARELELAFHPPGWSLGVAISLAALCVLFALSAVRIRRKRC